MAGHFHYYHDKMKLIFFLILFHRMFVLGGPTDDENAVFGPNDFGGIIYQGQGSDLLHEGDDDEEYEEEEEFYDEEFYQELDLKNEFYKNSVSHGNEFTLKPSKYNHPNSVFPAAAGSLTTPRSASTVYVPSPEDHLAILDHGNLPEFSKHPVDGFIIRGKSDHLFCSVINAHKAYFVCNGEAMAAVGVHKETASVARAGGRDVVLRQVSLEVTRNMVEEFFGVFACHCDAWSAAGKVSSTNATVETAYLRKEFEVPPYGQKVELGSQIELRCHPPKGVPPPNIYWLKDRTEIHPDRDPNYLQAADGHLIIVQTREKDRGNYTCVAENVANRRLSTPAKLNVIVSGGWSEWSGWSECIVSTSHSNCIGGTRTRERFCNNPPPKFGGPFCQGQPFEKAKCGEDCKESGFTKTPPFYGSDDSWSDWSSWSICGADCFQERRRVCSTPNHINCRGQDQVIQPCRGGRCGRGINLQTKDTSESSGSMVLTDRNQHHRNPQEEIVATDFSLLVGLSVALVVFLVITLSSIKFLRSKGRSPSVYTMTNLNYRRGRGNNNNNGGQMVDTSAMEVDSSSAANGNPVVKNGSMNHSMKTESEVAKLLETRLTSESNSNSNNGNGRSSSSGYSDEQLLLNTPKTPRSGQQPNIVENLMFNEASVPNSPYAVSKTNFMSASVGNVNNDRSAGMMQVSEHQYDIPFSHVMLTPQPQRPSAHIQRSMQKSLLQNRLNNSAALASSSPPQLPKPKRRSQSSSKGQSGDSGDDMIRWPLPPSSNNPDDFCLQPRLVNSNTDNPWNVNNNGGGGGTIGSERSLNTSIYSDFPLMENINPSSGFDSDNLVLTTVTSSGANLSLPGLGVSLSIPEGALETSAEIYLAILTDRRDRPRLSQNQTLLSPVIAAGPPKTAFKKPVIFTFSHCANLKLGSWEMGLYHCDSPCHFTSSSSNNSNSGTKESEGKLSVDSNGDASPWVKLSSINAEPGGEGCNASSSSSSPLVMTTMEFDSAFVMTDFLSRFCVVGQSSQQQDSLSESRLTFASKVLRVSVFGKVVSSSMDLSIAVAVTDDLPHCVDALVRTMESKRSMILLEKPKSFYFQDGGADLTISLGDSATGWSLKPKTPQTSNFDSVWSKSETFEALANFSLQRVDPTVNKAAFKVSAFQRNHPETCQSFPVAVDVANWPLLMASTSSPPPPPAPSSATQVKRSTILSTNSSNSSNSKFYYNHPPPHQHHFLDGQKFRLPPALKRRLCLSLDEPEFSGLNDWRALAAGLHLEAHADYFERSSASPTEALLNLWETKSGAITDLVNVLRVIGRPDCAGLIENEIGPWI